MLKFGSHDALTVRRRSIPFGAGIRLLYASDLHVTRWAAHIVQQLDDVCRAEMPDVVLLGGDLVDLRNGLPLLSQWIAAQPQPVYAIAGNHDVLVGVDAVRAGVEAAGGRWLDARVTLHPRLLLDGCMMADDAARALLCAHDPAIFPQAARAGYRLVLAGHLHGGQCVLWQAGGRQYPGALCYRWTGDEFAINKTTMLVSRGVHDTLPIRLNCPREVIVCCC
jgi:uncharacterized protein